MIQLVRLLPAAGRGMTVVLLMSALLQPTLGLGLILATGQLIGHIPEAVRDGSLGVLLSFLVLTGICYGGLQLLNSAIPVLGAILGRRIDGILADRLMRAQLGPGGIAHLENAQHQDLAERAMGGLGGARWRPAEAPGALAALVAAGLGVVAACAVIVWLQWWLGLAVVLVTAGSARELWSHLLRMTLESVEAEHTADYRRLSYEYDLAVSARAAKEIRVFNFAPWILDRVRRRHAELLAFDLRHMAHADIREILALASYVVVVGGGFAWTATSEISLATKAVLAQALLLPLARLEPVFQALIDIRQSIRPIPALVRIEATIPADIGARSADQLPRKEIRLTDLRFHYPTGESEILCGLNLVIPAGSSMAIVGLNGAGKTTLIKLLCRFYEPTSGTISADGIPIDELDCSSWQSRIAATFQDFAHFPFTAADNVRFGHLDATHEQLVRAAESAGALDIATALPGSWETPLSRDLTGGVDLSGGQWQRIALARTVLAAQNGAGLLILDEPASHLDVRAEADLNERFLELTQGITTVLVAHRFSTVRRADRICVLDSGVVTELGTHEELVDRNGDYARMFRLQAARFA